MKVGELIEELKLFEPNTDVVFVAPYANEVYNINFPERLKLKKAGREYFYPPISDKLSKYPSIEVCNLRAEFIISNYVPELDQS